MMAGTACPGSPWSKTCSDSRSGSTEPRNEVTSQQGKCPWCGLFFRLGDVWNVDHLVPKSQGGTDAEDNLQLLHRHCHRRKHGKLPCSGVNDNHQTTEEPDAG